MKKGFSLIELMVSIGILTIISWVAFSFFLRFSMLFAQQGSVFNQVSDVGIAQDILLCDTAQAQSDKNTIFIKSQSIIFCQGDSWIGWHLKNDTLYRTKGIYSHGVWHDATQSVVLKGVNNFLSQVINDEQQIRAISYELRFAKNRIVPIKCTIALRTGQLYE